MVYVFVSVAVGGWGVCVWWEGGAMGAHLVKLSAPGAAAPAENVAVTAASYLPNAPETHQSLHE